MKPLIKVIKGFLTIVAFFLFFAFALNNQHSVTIQFIFGASLQLPLILLVLATFSIGLIVGILGMLSRWWKQRSTIKTQQHQLSQNPSSEGSVKPQDTPLPYEY